MLCNVGVEGVAGAAAGAGAALVDWKLFAGGDIAVGELCEVLLGLWGTLEPPRALFLP